MAKLAFRRIQTIFFPFSEMSFAVLPHRWVTETAEGQSSRQVLFISPDMLGAGFLPPGCLPMESFKAEVLFFNIHMESLRESWDPFIPNDSSKYCSLPLSHSQWGEHCLPDTSLIMGYLGFWCLATLYQQCLWWLQENDWELCLCVVYKVTNELQCWRKECSRWWFARIWCLPLQPVSGVAQGNSWDWAQPLAVGFDWPMQLSFRPYY